MPFDDNMTRNIRPLRWPHAAFAGLCLFAFAGCESFREYPKYPVKSSDEIAAYLHYYTDNVVLTAATDTTQKYRDEVIDGRLHVLNRMYDDFIQAIGSEKNAEEIGTDSATVALSGVATL